MQRDATLPIGVPALFLPGGVRGRMPPHVPPDIARLVAEYRQARGYVFEWGHIVVTERPPLLTWRVVPVALWEHVAIAVPLDPLPVPALLPLLAPLVRQHVAPHLPAGVRLAGAQRAGRRCAYALFTLVHDDAATRRQADAWIHR